MFLDSSEADLLSVVSDSNNSASGMVEVFKQINPKASHLLVLQDDILPCRDLIATAKRLIELKPEEVISLFTIYDTDKPLSMGKHWATIDRLFGLCAYIIPADLAKGFVSFNEKIKDRIYADDVRLSMYLKELGLKVWLTAPSLVEHICWDRTSQGDNKVKPEFAIKHRIARNYIGFEQSGLDIDWSKGLTITPNIVIGQKHDFIRHYKPTSAIMESNAQQNLCQNCTD